MPFLLDMPTAALHTPLPEWLIHTVCYLTLTGLSACRYSDKEVQRDKSLVSYDIVDKETKPYVRVEVNGQKKVSGCAKPFLLVTLCPRQQLCSSGSAGSATSRALSLFLEL
jgi:hypothetical protein